MESLSSMFQNTQQNQSRTNFQNIWDQITQQRVQQSQQQPMYVQTAPTIQPVFASGVQPMYNSASTIVPNVNNGNNVSGPVIEKYPGFWYEGYIR